ncbi:class I adenylate-forming enzyme family protein [Mumia sp. DW29H23]|uniref:class I adenylate-forming enzyme family protein n=1 Tax=Mumia sp. DW29H23 TaxID=3421241 RepID=UPI003D69E762
MEPVDIGFRPTIGDAVRRAADEFGGRDYVVTLEDRLTYADAEAASASLARRMLARGVGKGTRVGLFYPNGTDWVVAWLAASRIGAVVLPLSTLYAPGELRKVLRLGDVDVLLAPATVLKVDVPAFLEEALPGLAAHAGPELGLVDAPYLRRVWLDGTDDVPAWAVPFGLRDETNDSDVGPEILAAVEAEVTPADPAIIIHTSGTTADPKGVVHSHAVLMRQSAIIAPIMREVAPDGLEPKYFCAMPFFWIGGILGVTGTLHAPVALLVMARLEPGGALELIERERGTSVAGWPTFTQRMRLHPDFARRDLSSAPTLLEGPADLALMGAPDTVPRHRSMTETGGSFLTTDILVVDEDGKEVPIGEEGELLVRGPGFMLGYNKREDWEVVDVDGWLHTGDRVFLREDDPAVYFAGRFTELIKTSGANVSPKEVEAVIDEHPDVRHCFVVGVGDGELGQEVVAAVVPQDPETFDPEKVAAHLRTELSPYKIPKRWIVVDDVPLLPTTKPDKRELLRRIEAGEIG